MVKIALEQTADVFPPCHDLKQRLINRFFIMSLKTLAKQQAEKEREIARIKHSGGERGSRSSTMKKAVDETK